MRINKYLSHLGVCSRREADRLIDEGKVLHNGEVALMGVQVEEGDEVSVNGKIVTKAPERVYIALNKPRGITCTTAKADKTNVVDYVGYKERIYPMGRLDKDSEGLLILTNDGELMDQVLRARNHHEKEYIVTVNRPLKDDFVPLMEKGVEILDTVTRPCKVRQLGPRKFSIILTQGLNRQIRRMCEALDYEVKTLKRIRIVNIKLQELPLGKWRHISDAEIEQLKRHVSK